jgi:hypothetical protein
VITHTCSVPNCRLQIASRLLMCPRHWRLVPSDLQAKVYAAYDDYQTGTIRVTGLRRIQAEATKAVADRIGEQPCLPGMEDDDAA